MLFIDRGVEYEFRLSARNGVDYGDVTTSTLRTPDGSESVTWPSVMCHQDGCRTTSCAEPKNTTKSLSFCRCLAFPGLFPRALYPSAELCWLSGVFLRTISDLCVRAWISVSGYWPIYEALPAGSYGALSWEEKLRNVCVSKCKSMAALEALSWRPSLKCQVPCRSFDQSAGCICGTSEINRLDAGAKPQEHSWIDCQCCFLLTASSFRFSLLDKKAFFLTLPMQQPFKKTESAVVLLLDFSFISLSRAQIARKPI